MSVFDRMNRKQKREFDKLDKEEKLKMFQVELNKVYNEQTKNEIINSFYRGFITAHKMLKEKYVDPIDKSKTPEEAEALIDAFWDEINRVSELDAKTLNKENEDTEKEND